jgi:hypothetical protein
MFHMERVTTADILGTADGLELEALALVQVARLLRLLVADRDRLRDRLRDCGYPEESDRPAVAEH